MSNQYITSFSHGAIAAGDQQSAEAGAVMLRMGGNAADAAVAASLAACVCEIALCGPLGGGVAVSQFPDQKPSSWDFFARVPGLGHALDDRLEFGRAVIDFGVTQQTFQVGRGAAALGLALPGLIQLHRRHGVLPLSEVVQPAVELGRKGYRVGQQMAYILSLIEPIFKWTKASHELCFPNGKQPVVGDRLFNPQLADVLDVLGKDPREMNALYLQFCREFGPDSGGLITPADVLDLSVRELEPIEFHWRNWRLSSMPAPSSGGVLIGLGSRHFEGAGERLNFGSRGYFEQIASVQKWLLDFRTEEFDERIESKSYVHRLLNELTLEQLNALPNAARADNYIGSTTQISAMDGNGGVVSLTLTNGEGCGCVLDGCGIQINNLLGEEDINPKGFHQAEPGTPMQTMMAPTIGHSGDRIIALGSGGSNRLRNAIMTTLLNVIEFDMPIDDAVHHPRLHVDRTERGTCINVENQNLPNSLMDLFRERFETVTVFDDLNMFFGGVHAVQKDGQCFSGVGDKRRGGFCIIP